MVYPYQLSTLEEYKKAYQLSIEAPEQFWASVAEHFTWKKKWDKVLEWNFRQPDIKWFINGKLNITENCLDRHLEKSGDTIVMIWEPNDPKEEKRTLTYKELHSKVCAFANVLRNNGVKKGDRI